MNATRKFGKLCYVCFASSMIFLSSCSQDPFEDTHSPQQTETLGEVFSPNSFPLSLQEGMLVFESHEDFVDANIEISQSPNGELKTRLDQLRFTSLKDIFETIHVEENKLAELIDQLPKAEGDALYTKTDGHSDIYYKHLKAGLIRETIETLPNGENFESYELSVYSDMYASLINEKGFVSVAGKIYRITDENLIEIEDGDFSKVPTLSFDQGLQQSKGVTVHEMKAKNLAKDRTILGPNTCARFEMQGVYGIKTELFFRIYDISDWSFKVESRVLVTGRKKRGRRWRYQPTDDLTARGYIEYDLGGESRFGDLSVTHHREDQIQRILPPHGSNSRWGSSGFINPDDINDLRLRLMRGYGSGHRLPGPMTSNLRWIGNFSNDGGACQNI